VPDIIKSGQIIKEEKNWKGRKYDGFIIAAPVEIAGIACIGTVVIHKDEKSQRFYFQEVILKEKLQKGASFKTEALTNNNVALNGDAHAGAIASLLQKIYAVNASKIVDENGEPRILYHGTDADISEFSAKKIRNSVDLRRIEGLSSQSGGGKPSHPAPTSTRLNDYYKRFLQEIKPSSKVVDENGEPMVVYHGTPVQINDEAIRNANPTSISIYTSLQIKWHDAG